MKTTMRAILFDFDGVIANSEPIHLTYFQEVLEREGIHLSSEEYFEKYLGLDDQDLFETIYRERNLPLSDEQKKNLMHQKNIAVLNHFSGLSLLMPGVADLIEFVSSRYYVGIVSGAVRSEILAVLDGAGITKKFQVIVGADDVSRGKPDPEGYLSAVRLLNRDFVPHSEVLLAKECLVIEDSPWGIEAAQEAGCKCLAVMTSYSEDRLTKADLVAKDLTKFPWEKVEKLFEAH